MGREGLKAERLKAETLKAETGRADQSQSILQELAEEAEVKPRSALCALASFA
jgi:hypothetical protein